MSSSPFTIRDAGIAPNDADFIVAAFDSTVPYLASIGSIGQWGPSLFSEKDGFPEATQADVEQSHIFRLTGGGEKMRIFIAQVEDTDPDTCSKNGNLSWWTDETGTSYLSAGMVTVKEDKFAQHVLSNQALEQLTAHATEEGNFLWIDVLITDHRLGENRKGAGGVLMRKAIEFAKENNKKRIFVDCWTGGSGKLVSYYEKFGFKPVRDFAIMRKDGTIWPGMLLCLDLEYGSDQQQA